MSRDTKFVEQIYLFAKIENQYQENKIENTFNFDELLQYDDDFEVFSAQPDEVVTEKEVNNAPHFHQDSHEETEEID